MYQQAWNQQHFLGFQKCTALCCVVSSLDGRPSILAPQAARLDEVQICPTIFVVKDVCDLESSHEIQRTMEMVVDNKWFPGGKVKVYFALQ